MNRQLKPLRKPIFIKTRECLLSVWLVFKGIVFSELCQPIPQSIVKCTYCQQLDKLNDSLKQKRPELFNRKGIVFHPVTQPESFTRSTRFADSQHSFAVKLEKCRTTSFANMFVPMTSRNWNSLPASIFPSTYNLQTFKTRVHKHLRLHPLT